VGDDAQAVVAAQSMLALFTRGFQGFNDHEEFWGVFTLQYKLRRKGGGTT
jgi:hypothetical protein